jgi:hypothetical protein
LSVFRQENRPLIFLDDLNNGFWEHAIQRARIFCILEDCQNLLMWAHYAGQHTGAVLELKCIEGIENSDTPLCVARKVEYRKHMPKIGSYKEIFLHSLGLVPKPTNNTLYRDLAFVKSDLWSYENEWRCITYREEGLYNDFKFYPEEITKIYFGCRMKDKDKEEVMRLLQTDFNHVEVFEMQIDEVEYKLNSKKIK